MIAQNTPQLLILPRHDWLIRLRWLAALAAVLVALIARFDTSQLFPTTPLWQGALVICLTNMWLVVRQQSAALAAGVTGSILAFDTLVLTYVLYWTGGPMNPFSMLYIVHIALGAVLLGTRWTWILTALSSGCYLFLFGYHHPLQLGHADGHNAHLDFHLSGMLYAFVVCAVLLAFFLTRITKALQQQHEQLRKADAKQLDELRLISLATLSAGAAHELNSPLSTIAVEAGELKHMVAEGVMERSALLHTADAIRAAIARCQQIVARMKIDPLMEDATEHLPFTLEALAAQLKEALPEKERERVQFLVSDGKTARSLNMQGLRQSILSLLQNALDASLPGDPVRCNMYYMEQQLCITVEDSGRGMNDDELRLSTAPFFSTKQNSSRMGLGLFLTEQFVMSNHGTLRISSPAQGGTKVVIEFPLYKTATGTYG